MGAELFHADGQTDGHAEAHSRFAQFCERTNEKGEEGHKTKMKKEGY